MVAQYCSLPLAFTLYFHCLACHILQTHSLLSSGIPRIIDNEKNLFVSSLNALSQLEPLISHKCSRQFGADMLVNFRNTKRVVCENLGSLGSNILCHQRIPFDKVRYICELHNIQISPKGAQAMGCKTTRWYHTFLSDLMQRQKNNFMAHGKLMRWDQPEDTLLGNGKLQLQDSLACTHKILHPVLLQIPWDTNNFYEWFGDWVTLWETLASLQWKPEDTELFLITAWGEGGDIVSPVLNKNFKRPFDEAWFRLFQAKGVRVGFYDDLFHDGMCFSHVATVPNGGISTISFAGSKVGFTQCKSPVVMAATRLLQGLFPWPVELEKKPVSMKRATLILRAGTRQFDDDTKAAKAVKEVLPPGWMLTLFRPEHVKNFAEQIALVADTDLLIGVHGTGLTFLAFLPPQAHVVEIFCKDRSGSNGHYRSLENMVEPMNIQIFASVPVSRQCTVEQGIVQKAALDHGVYKKSEVLPITLVNSTPQHRLAIIVAFHDCGNNNQSNARWKNLYTFSAHMHAYLANLKGAFHIFVVQPHNQGLFNKGVFLNAGFIYAMGLHTAGFDYVAFHDVDQVPVSQKSHYAYPTSKGPIRICTKNDLHNGRRGCQTNVTGAMLMHASSIMTLNGYSNNFWGVGCENDDLFERAAFAFGGVDELGPNESMCKSLFSGHGKSLVENLSFSDNSSHFDQKNRNSVQSNGLAQATNAYTLESVEALENFTVLNVTVHMPAAMPSWITHMVECLAIQVHQ